MIRPPDSWSTTPGACPAFGADALFTQVIVEYLHRYPEVRVQLEEGGSKRIEQALPLARWSWAPPRRHRTRSWPIRRSPASH